mgnify:CR=1 FL=1
MTETKRTRRTRTRRKPEAEELPALEKISEVQTKVQSLAGELNSILINRRREIDGLLVALLAREHCLLLGPPGTAKSALTELLCRSIDGAKHFSWLMSKFTVPEELFGPFSLAGLKQDRFERMVKGKLPEADIAFLDEIFKANSSILNNLLTLINERRFANGTQTLRCPLQTMVGASNELPEGKELGALYDRFLVRFWVGYLTDRSERMALLKMPKSGSVKGKINLQELEEAQNEAENIHISDEMFNLLLDCQEALGREGFVCSDRRWRKTLKILRAKAYLDGYQEVMPRHFDILADSLWHEPNDRLELQRIILKTCNPNAAKIQKILDIAESSFQAIPMDQQIPESEVSTVFTQMIEVNADLRKQLEALHKIKTPEAKEAAQKVNDMIEEIGRYTRGITGLRM